MYGMTNSGKLFDDDLTEWLLEAGFIQSQYHMYIYYKFYKYAPDGTIFLKSYADDCLYGYTYETLGKWFADTLGKRFHVNFLGYENWFMSIITYQMNDHSMSIYQARYATNIVVNTWILPQLRQVQSFTRLLFHLV